MFGGNFAPAGWKFCDGQLMAIVDNESLWFLIGTTYGGDGSSTFALPDLRGRVPIHQGNSFVIAQQGGTEQVTLTVNQIPAHSHPLLAVNATGNQTSPAGSLPAQSFNVTPYINDAPTGNFNVAAVAPTGGNQPHDNRMPYLCIDFIISLNGIYPTQT
jgi:microcystin-dependent protein